MGKTYVMSDIHGCYREYKKALELIQFKNEDTLYILGDVVDRGEQPMEILKDMMCRPNVYPIVGNHEQVAAFILGKLCVEITEDNAETQINEKLLLAIADWKKNGGDTTLDEFSKLSMEEKEDILDYLGEFTLYEEVEVNGKEYVLVHAGLENFSPDKSLDEYTIDELLWARVDYDKPYFDDVITVTGHTPTLNCEGNEGTIIKKNNHIAIDCGCVYGGNLAVYCLDDGEEFYVKRG